MLSLYVFPISHGRKLKISKFKKSTNNWNFASLGAERWLPEKLIWVVVSFSYSAVYAKIDPPYIPIDCRVKICSCTFLLLFSFLQQVVSKLKLATAAKKLLISLNYLLLRCDYSHVKVNRFNDMYISPGKILVKEVIIRADCLLKNKK